MLLLKVSTSNSWRLCRSISTAENLQTHDKELLDFFDSLLRICYSSKPCKQIHAQIIVTDSHRSAFLASRLVAVYSNLGIVRDFKRVFHSFPIEISSSNRLLWNAIVRANVTHGFYKDALKLFDEMLKRRVLPDGFTFPWAIKACSFLGGTGLCKGIHCHVIKMGFRTNLHSANELLGMYGKIGRMNDVRRVFDGMPSRSQVSWNTLISGYALNYDCDGARETVRRMESQGIEPNPVTWTSLLSSHARCGRYAEFAELFGSMMGRSGARSTAESLAVALSVCADLGAISGGKMVHGYLIKGGFERYVFANNAVICMYGKCGDVEDAKKSFYEMEIKNLVTWNAMISSYADSGYCDEALKLFKSMVLKPNIVTWSALIGGLASKGRGKEALELFRVMQATKTVQTNSVTICSVLRVCADLAALNLGRELHCHAIRAEMDGNVLVGNALINAYTKSGALEKGNIVFERLEGKDVISWNSMMSGYGIHGLGKEALEIFDKMVESRFEPDEVTFVAVLAACSHSGLVSEGRLIFNKMGRDFGIVPQPEHLACLVDLLARAGLLDEASEVAQNIPGKPEASVWGALLSSCRAQKNISKKTMARILDAGPSFALLSNFYAADKKWEEAARVRISARSEGLKKVPGQSWIQVKDRIFAFSAGNVSDPICRVVEELGLQMESEREGLVINGDIRAL